MGKKKKTKATSGSAVAAQDLGGNDGPAFEEAAKTVEAPAGSAAPATSSNADATASASAAPVVKMHVSSDSASPAPAAAAAAVDIQPSSTSAASAPAAAEPAASAPAAAAAPAVEKKAALSSSPKASSAKVDQEKSAQAAPVETVAPPAQAAAPAAVTPAAVSPAKPAAAASAPIPAPIITPAPAAANVVVSAAPAAALAPVASSVATPNPHAAALAAILLTPLKKVKPDVSTFSASSLDSIFSQIQSLPYDVKSQFFASITSRKADVNASSDLPSKIFALITNYLSDGLHSGSNHDPVCKFFYEAYWEASTKMLNSDAKGSSKSAVDALPIPHLFVLQFLPQIIYQFLLKFSSNASIASPASFAGLFTVCLAVYNTERILSARTGFSAANAANSHSIPLEVEQLLGECKSLDVHAITPLWNASNPFNRVPTQNHAGMRILPSILEPNRAATALLVHILLAKYVKSLAALSTLSSVSQESIESFVYLIGATCGNGSAHQMFAFIQPFLSASPVAPGSFAVTWPTTWRQSVPVSFSFRFDWTSDILQDFLDGLSWILSSKTLISSSASSARFQEFVLSALRQVHGRALEELQPIILLQTTQMLEQQEQSRK